MDIKFHRKLKIERKCTGETIFDDAVKQMRRKNKIYTEIYCRSVFMFVSLSSRLEFHVWN